MDAEIERILAMGVTLELNTTVTDILAELSEAAGGHGGEGCFDAAFVAVGAHIGKRAYIPAGDSAKIMDAARTARRLGAAEAVVVYRRTRDRMPAHDVEVEEALEEGVTMRWLSTVTAADTGSLTIEKMRLDDAGFPQPTGEFEELSADCLVLALGQDADLAVLDGVRGVTFSGGTVDMDRDLMAGHPGIFAGGDMVPAERTVTVAIGHGKSTGARKG
jgi:NADPH-dependent glutamate synthase beta subunit-like oxidoreductase